MPNVFIDESYHGLQKISPLQLKVGQNAVHPPATGRNLGVFFDDQMSMARQVNSIISSLNLQLRNITKRIKRNVTKKTDHHVVRALILSHMDYCNSLLYGIKSNDIRRLQSLQHKAAKLIFCAPRHSDPTPLMKSLHWVPLNKRIKFKLCFLIYKCLRGGPVSIVLNNENRPEPDGTAGQPAVGF